MYFPKFATNAFWVIPQTLRFTNRKFASNPTKKGAKSGVNGVLSQLSVIVKSWLWPQDASPKADRNVQARGGKVAPLIVY
jgi:hypothetical protein